MSVDVTILHTALTGLADTLEAAALDIPWVPSVCVTPVEPGVDCDTIHVWPGEITTDQNRCQVAPIVSLRWRIATCIGAETTEDCDWWTARTQDPLERLWGIYGGLLAAYNDGTLCAAMAVTCEDVRFGAVNPVPSADYVAFEGSVRVRLDVTLVTS